MGGCFIHYPDASSGQRMTEEDPWKNLELEWKNTIEKRSLLNISETPQYNSGDRQGRWSFEAASAELWPRCDRVIAPGCCLLRVLLLHFAFCVVSTWKLEAPHPSE